MLSQKVSSLRLVNGKIKITITVLPVGNGCSQNVMHYFGVTVGVGKANACNLDVTCNVPQLAVSNF
jgi:hypothetical protein